MLKMTALHWAAQHGHHNVAQTLLKHGADVHALSKFDKTPFDIAVDIQNTELMLLLQVRTQPRDGSVTDGQVKTKEPVTCVCVCSGGHAEPGECEPGEHECGDQQQQPTTVHHPGDSCHPRGCGQPGRSAQQGQRWYELKKEKEKTNIHNISLEVTIIAKLTLLVLSVLVQAKVNLTIAKFVHFF